MTARGLSSVTPGARVQFTGYYLRATDQMTGSEGSKRWTVLACDCDMCKGGQFCAVDEAHGDEYRALMWGDLPEDRRPIWRHIALGNLQIYGKVPRAADCADAMPPMTNGNGSRRKRVAA